MITKAIPFQPPSNSRRPKRALIDYKILSLSLLVLLELESELESESESELRRANFLSFFLSYNVYKRS